MIEKYNVDYLKVAEELYREENPSSKMDVPNSVYETTEKWFKEWVKECMHNNTRLDLKDWIKQNKK